jgi:FkbM family methyltransferase
VYDQDRLIYLKTQINDLCNLEHDLEKIVFVVNYENEHSELFAQAQELIPNKIRNADVELIQRKNIGMSYGAWSDVFGKYKDTYDYYIFTEDDYFFNINNFDQYLIKKFNSLPNTGYLCMVVRRPTPEYPAPVHAGNSIGFSSYKVLNEAWEKYGCLPHTTEITENAEYNYRRAEEVGQVEQSNAIYRLGYNIWDVREDYAIPHDMGYHSYPVHLIHIYFYWNKEMLILPAAMKLSLPIFYVNIIDSQYQKNSLLANFNWGPMEHTSTKEFLINEIFIEKVYNKLYDVQEGDIVVDIGASVGPFTYFILDKKPLQVYTLEPSKVEFPILVKNTLGMPVCNINKAIYEGDGITNAFDTYFWNGNVETIKFKTFRELYAIEYIDFLKTDCEGGEYYIFNEENIDFLVNNVKVIVGEWHLENQERKEKFKKFIYEYLPRFKQFDVYSLDGIDIKWDLYNEHFLNYYNQVIFHINNKIDE